jgi:aryl sulfotransferase
MERYHNLVFDSARWADFAFRDDDIIISTPPKCGTTWTQMLCALLVFDATTFDRPLARISPWLDMLTRPLDSVVADLEAQTHRRFIKTHTPLDGLPFDERVTYLCVGRDPRDVALSWDHHFSNVDIEALINMRAEAVGLDDLEGLEPPSPPAEDPKERFFQWVDGGDGVSAGLDGTLHHVQTFWDRRDAPNIALFHYSDLSRDLPGQLARLAEVLSIDLPPERIEELAAAATFDRMKNCATALAPNSDQGLWVSTESFFHRGGSGHWQALLDDEDLARYEARLHELAPADLAAWVQDGWLVGATGS